MESVEGGREGWGVGQYFGTDVGYLSQFSISWSLSPGGGGGWSVAVLGLFVCFSLSPRCSMSEQTD